MYTHIRELHFLHYLFKRNTEFATAIVGPAKRFERGKGALRCTAYRCGQLATENLIFEKSALNSDRPMILVRVLYFWPVDRLTGQPDGIGIAGHHFLPFASFFLYACSSIWPGFTSRIGPSAGRYIDIIIKRRREREYGIVLEKSSSFLALRLI